MFFFAKVGGLHPRVGGLFAPCFWKSKRISWNKPGNENDDLRDIFPWTVGSTGALFFFWFHFSPAGLQHQNLTFGAWGTFLTNKKASLKAGVSFLKPENAGFRVFQGLQR